VRRLRALVWRLADVFVRRRRERDMAAEIAANLELHIADNLRAGMPPDEARRRAVVALGGVEAAKERYRDRRGLPSVDALLQDLRYAARTFRRSPAFTLVAVSTLALGIGANTAIFSVVNAVLLRPLPFRDAARMVQIFATDARRGDTTDVVSYPTAMDWSARSRTIDRMTPMVTRSVFVADATSGELVRSARVGPSFFDLYGVQPPLGRPFTAEEHDAGRAAVAILSDGYWKRRFAADPRVVGTTIRINDQPHTIVGVMPPGFSIEPGSAEQLYQPLTPDPNRGHGFLRVVGRLRDAATLAQARAELTVIADQLAREYPRQHAGTGANVMPLVDAIAGPGRVGLLILLAVVCLVLLIACMNVANLLLARASARQREMAVRAALGAGRARLARQLLTESVLLALAGGAAGLVAAEWTTRGLIALLSGTVRMPRLDATTIDARVLLFTLAVSLATGIVFGLVPALSTSRTDLAHGLRESSRSATGAGASRLRGFLVVAEIAAALVLLAGAGALLGTLLTLRGTAPGFSTHGLVVVDVWLPQPRYAKMADRLQYFDGVLAGLRRVPGVTSAGLVADLPLGGGQDSLGFHIPGKPDPAPGASYEAGFNLTSTDYFRTMGIPIVDGREFAATDGESGPAVALANETAAKRFWPGEPAMGRQIVLSSGSAGPGTQPAAPPPFTIVGVVGDVRHESLGRPARPEFYLHTRQANVPWPYLVLVARTTNADPLSLAPTLKALSRSVDPLVPVQNVQTMDDVLSASMAEPRVYTILLGLFAALALGLAAVGLYGVVSYGVAQRTQELGIRIALGASRGEIVRLVLAHGLGLAASGAALGLGGAIAGTRALAGAVRDVQAGGFLTLAAVTAALIAVAGLASYLPARRAARVDAMAALRAE
jgi:putative ABC transport system permease protein